ncbi:MAG: protein-L-isoaspartate(D-aspartate) O-methyltransferase [Patescibacteria group bacterium]|nr:protein-L-isoaspartate(D-aspartate) O-methyltransferase [Patescibacteria group bacterium]
MDREYQAMLELLSEEGYLKNPRHLEAFQKIRRADFMPEGLEREAAVNAPLPIGENQTISQPLTVAFMLELLDPQPGQKVLDVGSGSGWTAALLAQLVGAKGHVYAVELIASLHAFGQRNVAKYPFRNITMLCGDGTQGLPEHAPYDRIQVAAAAREIPKPLLDQLAVGGRMIIPTQKDDLRLVVRESEKKYTTKIFSGFLFVPLIEKPAAGGKQ